MSGTWMIICVGLAGGFLFHATSLPGGPMTGAMIAVIAFKTFHAVSGQPQIPAIVRIVVYSLVGCVVGNMYRPEMLEVVKASWKIMSLSTGLLLLAGCLCTFIVARYTSLSVGSAYLATSPGGLNAIIGLSASMDSQEIPIVIVYHLVRIYVVVIIAPYVASLLNMLMRH